MKRLIYLHPFILAAISAVILFVSMSNVGINISPADVIIPTVWALVICLVLYLVSYLLTRQLQSAALITSLFVLGLIHLWYIFLAVICITLLSILIFKVVLKKVHLSDFNVVLTIISIFIFGFYLFRFVSFIVANPPLESSSRATEPVMAGQRVTASTGRLPDIYYIILDGYGRQDMLQEVHGFDDSPFITALQQRGFVIAPKSQSNYSRTLLSLSSSLNMQYLDTLSAAMGNSNLWWPAGDSIQHSQVRSFLESQGYKTVFISSGWDYTDIRDGDMYLKAYPIMLRNFQMGFISWTNLRFFGNNWSGISFPSANESRRVVLHDFEALESTVEIAGPKFVFSHIMAPHPPYIFGSDGGPAANNIVHPDPGTPGYDEAILRYRQGYLDQMAFINQKTLDMLDAILANSITPPVIILQGDHGPDVYMDFEDPAKACLYERYSILNAYYLPGVPADALPADISPVNSFRLVFNRYFGTDLAMLPNQRYFSTDYRLYQFQNVTSLTENTCSLPSAALP